MKKRFLLFLTVLFFAGKATAQSPITLRWQDYQYGPVLANRVSVITDYLKLAQLNFYTGSTNALWDLQNISPDGNSPIYYSVTPIQNPNGLPIFQYDLQVPMQLGNITYAGANRYRSDTVAINRWGDSISAQSINLAATTGNATDMLTIPAQFNNYTYPDIDYPATYNSTWSSSSFLQFYTQFYLTIAAAQFTNQPLVRSTKRTSTSTVIGWGKAIVTSQNPARLGQPSEFLDVLQIAVTEVDTIIHQLSGNPGVDSVVLKTLALEDTMVKTTSYIQLVRKGENTPLLSVRYNGLPSSSAPEIAWMQNYDHLNPLAVSTFTPAPAVAVYPNPVRSGGALSIDCSTTGNWQLRLSSLTGQQVLDARWNRMQSGTEAVQMPPVAAGVYIYQLFREGQPVQAGRMMLGE